MARFLLVLFACVASVAAQSVMVRNSMMSGNAGQPQTAETTTTAMGPNGETISISIGITIISSSQGGSSETTMMGSPTMAVGMTHQVTVGGSAGLVYTPSSIEAAVGDMVQFNFMSANHTLTQATFPLPCVAMASGADSGFMPNANNTVNPPPSFMVQVTSMAPMWFYCRQKGHCGKGMTFSINPTAEKTQAEFMAMAIAQNGTASAPPAAVSAAAAASAPPAVASAAAAASAPPAVASAAPAAASAAAAPPAASSGLATVVAGTGTMNGDSCSCSCLCGVNAFPSNAGIGNFGGMG
ncbi:hypothetical protein MMC14_007237, partial [Varicellaria rhodocarpa]|nr:hypothetical protein [Varicellaria rhodocarpa]